MTWNSHSTLTGGTNSIAGSTNVVTFPYDNFINHGLVSDLGLTIYAGYFEHSGFITNGANGSFLLQAQAALLTNGAIYANGDLSITAQSVVVSNVTLSAGRSLTLQTTNLLGPWITNNTATSPYTVSPTNAQSFFRVQIP